MGQPLTMIDRVEFASTCAFESYWQVVARDKKSCPRTIVDESRQCAKLTENFAQLSLAPWPYTRAGAGGLAGHKFLTIATRVLNRLNPARSYKRIAGVLR